MVSATDGSAFTSTVTVYVTGDAGTQAIGSVGSGICTHEGNGYHTYAPSQAETNYDLTAFTFIGTGAVPSTVQVFNSFPQTADNATNISAIKTKTDFLPSATAGASGGVFIAGSNAATTVNFTGNLSGSVGSVTAAITLPTIPTNWISATGIASSAITSAKFASGAITSTVLAANAIGASQIAADAIGASELATDAVTEIVTAVWANAARTLTAATNFNNLSQADIRTAVGLASANLDTQLSTIDTVVDAVLVDTAEIGAAGAGLTSIPWNASWDAEVESECTDALNAYDPPTKTEMDSAFTEIKGATFSGTTDSLEAIRDRGDAAWAGGGSAPTAAEVADAVWAEAIADHSGVSGSTAESLAAAGGSGDPWITSLPGSYTGTQAGKILADILDDTGTTIPGTIATVDANVDAILVDTGTSIPASIDALPTAAENRAEMDSNSTQLAAIVADTGELQTDWANGGRLDLLIDAIKVVTDALPDSGALSSLATAAALATVDGNVDAVLVDTGTSIPALIAALNDLAASDILTTQLTESYAADGVAPTLSEAIFLIQQFLYERSTSGTSVTVKKLDGSTTAATLTLDDDTSPTSITRAS